jgi:cell division protein ZapE
VNESTDVLGACYARETAKRGFASDRAQLAALAALERLRAELAAAAAAPLGRRLLRGLTRDNGAHRGVYLWGGVGRGKTWLMDLFYSSLTTAQKRRTHFYRFMQEVHADLKRLKGMQSPLDGVADKIAKKAQVVCFDELFVSDIADAMILAGLFGALVKRGVALVFTSNVRPKDLYKGGLQRERFLPTIALIEKHCEVIAVDGGVDYRLRQLTAASIYLPTAAADTQRKLEELFDDLSDDDVETGGTITVHHRKIKVLRESENVIWFDFAALCEGTAQSGRLHRDRQRVPVGGHQQRAGAARHGRQRRAPLHLGDRRVLRSRRERDHLGGRAAERVVQGREAQVRVPAHHEPLDRDAERGVPRPRASRGVGAHTAARTIEIVRVPCQFAHPVRGPRRAVLTCAHSRRGLS